MLHFRLCGNELDRVHFEKRAACSLFHQIIHLTRYSLPCNRNYRRPLARRLPNTLLTNATLKLQPPSTSNLQTYESTSSPAPAVPSSSPSPLAAAAAAIQASELHFTKLPPAVATTTEGCSPKAVIAVWKVTAVACFKVNKTRIGAFTCVGW